MMVLLFISNSFLKFRFISYYSRSKKKIELSHQSYYILLLLSLSLGLFTLWKWRIGFFIYSCAKWIDCAFLVQNETQHISQNAIVANSKKIKMKKKNVSQFLLLRKTPDWSFQFVCLFLNIHFDKIYTSNCEIFLLCLKSTKSLRAWLNWTKPYGARTYNQFYSVLLDYFLI